MSLNAQQYFYTDKPVDTHQSDDVIAQKIVRTLKGTSKTPAGTYRVHLTDDGSKVTSPCCDTLEEAWGLAADFYGSRGNESKAAALRWAATVISPEVSKRCSRNVAKEAIEEITGLAAEEIDEQLLETLEGTLQEFLENHPPLNTELHEPLPKRVREVHEAGPRQIECFLCGTTFTHPRLVGRPPSYCSSACRSTVARLKTTAWKIANGFA